MKAKIKELKLKNFKGQRDFTLNPNEDITSIHGTNGSGKSTLCDAWMWLWTGKDMKGRQDFEIKTKRSTGEVEHHLDHEVSVIIDVDGVKYDASRIYKEQWVKPTGEKYQVLKSHTTDYIFDSIPLSKKGDFDDRINNLFGEPEQFKLLSIPGYFLNIDWKKRRQLLMLLASVTDESVMKKLAESDEDFAKLMQAINNNSLDDFRKKLNYEKKDLKKRIDEIPIRIKEAKLAIPKEPDYTAIETEIKTKENELSSIDDQISNISKSFENQASQIKDQQNILLDKERKLAKIENEAKIEAERLNEEGGKKLSDLNSTLVKVETSIRSLTSDQALIINKIHNKESEIGNQNEILYQLRDEYKSISESVMNESDTVCPTCNQVLPDKDMEEAVKKFNVEKEHKIQKNITRGKSVKETVEILSAQLDEFFLQKNEIVEKIIEIGKEKELIQAEINEEINTVKKAYSSIDMLENYEDYKDLKVQIDFLKLNIQEIKQPDISDLKEKRKRINGDINSLKEQLSIRNIANIQNKRVEELEDELKTLSQELSTIEGKEFIADKFNRSKIEAIESGINGLFPSIRWKMFNSLVNGNDEECCEAVLGCGNIYEAANNAGRINAGIECINTLSKFYDMHLPLFIDNSESICELIPTKSQVIRLVVDENFKLLTIK